MTRRYPTRLQTLPATQPYTRGQPADSAASLPLDDRRCPRREVAVLCETDSGYRWDEA